MNASEREAVNGVRVLWPYLTYNERLEWVGRLGHLYDNEFSTTVAALSEPLENDNG